MKKGLLLLLTIVLLLSGCHDGGQYLSSAGLAMCLTQMIIVNDIVTETALDGHSSGSDAFSAWYWLEDCMQMMNKSIGENAALELMFDDMRLVCGACRARGWQSDDYQDANRKRIIDSINDFCERHAKYRDNPEG